MDSFGRERGVFTAIDVIGDLGAALWVEDKNGTVQARLRETEFWANEITAPTFHTLDMILMAMRPSWVPLHL
jgi:hypothetical protein